MPRANRYFVPGQVYHLTHRCHNRDFLLKFARDRDAYRTKLRQALVETEVFLLDYNRRKVCYGASWEERGW